MTSPTQCQLFKPGENQTDLMAAHLPLGGVFDAAREDGTNFRGLLDGISNEYFRIEENIFNACVELDPRFTTDLILEWERSVGIPDDCLTTATDIERRRIQVLFKLRGLRLQTADDFINLGAVLGITIEIEAGATSGIYPMAYPARYFATDKIARFTMIVHFPDAPDDGKYPEFYAAPYGLATTPFECVIRSAAPSTVNVIFSYGTHAP